MDIMKSNYKLITERQRKGLSNTWQLSTNEPGVSEEIAKEVKETALSNERNLAGRAEAGGQGRRDPWHSALG